MRCQFTTVLESYWNSHLVSCFSSFSNSSDGYDGCAVPWDPKHAAALWPDVWFVIHSWLMPFYLYLFSNRNFAAPLFHPVFDPAIPYFAIPLHVAHPAPPLAPAAPAAPPPASPSQVVPNIPFSPMSDLSKASESSSSSSGSDVCYSPVGPGMANDYLTE